MNMIWRQAQESDGVQPNEAENRQQPPEAEEKSEKMFPWNPQRDHGPV